ncbi:radical SAM protein [Paenibacillus glacialis]|uniref:Radical SAM core domain-containing protein n=1 Tax=Paenibacillus glacialis TaxID=494026 RepID=A0A168MLA4_9BACL|nr:radical SAM/SPASM domain-containing protein [Paenibacillus glacialis]OAB44807.1 hypothetical protein PGLA_05185 [Paenibacillus glacialis]
MNDAGFIKFHRYFRSLNKNSRVILGNILNGQWIKCPDYIYEFLSNCINKKYTIERMLGECEDPNTYEYIKKFVETLIEIEVISIEGSLNSVEEKISSITIELTTACNLNCIHCGAECDQYKREDINFDYLKKVVHWCEVNSIDHIALSGGEILVRTDIWGILKYVRSNYSGEIEIMTNATLLTKKNIERIVPLVNYISISLDGYDQESVTEIRGSKVFDKVLKVIEQLHEHDFMDISLSMILTKRTNLHRKDFEDLCSSLGVKPITRRLTPNGRADKNLDLIYPRVKGKNLHDFTGEKLNEMQRNMSFKCVCDLSSKLYLCANHEIYSCFLIIGPDYIKGTVDDLLLNRLEDVQVIPVTDRVESCKNCDVRYFCSSECPGHDNFVYNNENIRNELCNQMYNFYSKIVWNS